MFLIFLSLAVIGSMLLLTVIAFYNKKDSADMQTVRKSAGHSGPAQGGKHRSDTVKTIDGRDGTQASHLSSAEEAAYAADLKRNNGLNKGRGYVPVIFGHGKIPGVREHELVHFIGSGALFFIESELSPDEIEINPDELTEVVDGDLVLTSKQIVVYSKEASKRIQISAIAKHQFKDSFLIIKRKRVKKKTDIIKISRRPVELRYILHTLL